MHEMSLCESLIRSIEEAAVTHAFTKVRVVRLEVGQFAGVEPDALRFGFDVVARGSAAEGAALEIIDKPGEAWCFDCGVTVEIADRLDPCPLCGGGKLHVTGGDRMIIKDLDVV